VGNWFSYILDTERPWVALLSVKYHHLTVSTVARIAHTIIGPETNLDITNVG